MNEKHNSRRKEAFANAKAMIKIMKKSGAKRKKKSGKISGLILAIVTFFNLALSVLLHVLRRQEIIHAVDSDEGVKLLLTEKKVTKEP